MVDPKSVEEVLAVSRRVVLLDAIQLCRELADADRGRADRLARCGRPREAWALRERASGAEACAFEIAGRLLAPDAV